MLQIDSKRLQADLEELGQIGRGSEGGMYRMAFSDADLEARKWFKAKIEAAGLECVEDQAGNIFGKLVGQNDHCSVLTGSHLDTVPCGGQMDGALGVITGLECLRTLSEQEATLAKSLEVVSFADEEGRFGGMFGSQTFTGQLTPGKLAEMKDLNGVALTDVLASRGYRCDEVLRAARNPKSIAAFVELHIEQGPILDSKNIPIGIVEAITGVVNWNVRFLGVANHSGTTPMNARVDAFQGVAELAREIPRIIEENGSQRSVANIGRIELKPGAANVIPGEANFNLEIRDTDSQILGDLSYAFRRSMSAIARRRGLMFDFEVVSELEPVTCDSGIVRLFKEVADSLEIANCTMASGAAHDTQNLAHIAPACLLFVPSKSGISHSPDEWTSWDDVFDGANVLVNTLHKLAS